MPLKLLYLFTLLRTCETHFPFSKIYSLYHEIPVYSYMCMCYSPYTSLGYVVEFECYAICFPISLCSLQDKVEKIREESEGF